MDLRVCNQQSLNQDKDKLAHLVEQNQLSAFKPHTPAPRVKAQNTDQTEEMIQPQEQIEVQDVKPAKDGNFTIDQNQGQGMPMRQPSMHKLSSQKTTSMEQHSQQKAKGKLSAGLKDLSLKVMEQVIKDGATTYSMVAS